MELQFPKNTVSGLKPVLQQIQNLEQTQELRIPEGMPEAAHVLACWGQAVLRGKEWNRDTLSASGGVMVWVLYAPENGSAPRRIETWVPFQTQWDLPPDSGEGSARMMALLRFADARTVTPGKLMLRVGLGILAEGWVPAQWAVYEPQASENLELLRRSYPLRLLREAGEKAFTQEETLTLPGSAPQPEAILYYRLTPEITDKKVLGGRLVFRGLGNLHLLYTSEEGQIHSWDFELPFSQFADLEGAASSDAQADIQLMPTNAELELDAEGKLHLRWAATAQYLLDDRQMVEIAEDAYSPGRELEIRRETVTVPVLLDSRREMVCPETPVPENMGILADACFLPDFPRQRRQGDSASLELPGVWQLLYYTDEGKLASSVQRWEGQHTLKADGSDSLSALPRQGGRLQTGQGSLVRCEVPLRLTASVGQGLPMITAVTAGAEKQPSPGRPSLILRRAEGTSLWELAKASGCAMDAIRSANGLEGDPAPGQLLLIPVP